MAPSSTRTDSPDPRQAVPSEPRPALYLVHHPEAARIGTRLVLPAGEGLLLGRDEDCLGPGALLERCVSRRHAELICGPEGALLRDLDSRNGTWVNGSRVVQALLRPGDVIGIGGLLLVFRPGPVEPEPCASPRLVGRSGAMARVLARVAQVAARDTTVLVLGETGCGKELVAREIHSQSGRAGPFVAVNCGGLPATLLQSELFGHARGAFSGADRARPGLVASAAGGTLFLDEIGEAPLDLQVTLMRLLQDRCVRPVGADREHAVDVRFIAATNRDLAAAVSAGQFRSDLLYRLQRWVIHVPALRERKEDIPALVAHVLERGGGLPRSCGYNLMLRLLCHAWPGNVRELEAVVERLVVEQPGTGSLEAPDWLPEVPSASPSCARADETPSGIARVARASCPEPDDLRRLLVESRGNVRALAEVLGVSRNTLYRWLQGAGIDPDSTRG